MKELRERNLLILAYYLLRHKKKSDLARMFKVSRQRIDELILSKVKSGVSKDQIDYLFNKLGIDYERSDTRS